MIDIFGEDIYSPNAVRYYGSGGYYTKLDNEAVKITQACKGKPNFPIRIYRAIPSNVNAEINDGDWVTIVKGYAIEHGEANLDGDYKIISKNVIADNIYTDGNSLLEQGYSV